MNILCDLISARQGFNKQQGNVFSPSIPSSLSLHIPSNHWHREVNRLVVPQRWWKVAVIESSSEPKLRSTREGLRVHRSPNAAPNWLNKGMNLSSCNLSSGVSLSPLLSCSHSTFVHFCCEQMSECARRGSAAMDVMLEKVWKFTQHRRCSRGARQSAKHWFINAK